MCGVRLKGVTDYSQSRDHEQTQSYFTLVGLDTSDGGIFFQSSGKEFYQERKARLITDNPVWLPDVGTLKKTDAWPLFNTRLDTLL